MAWRCSGKTNAELIANMQAAGLITSSRVAQAMSLVDRANYVVGGQSALSAAYTDAPQSIGFGATISAPHMHAHACEALLPFLKPGSRVLDVGSGSGYTMAIFHHLVKAQDPVQGQETGETKQEKNGFVVGIDHIEGLVDMAKRNLQKDQLGPHQHRGGIQAVLGDGRKGFVARAPYDAIHVGAAAPFMPQDLIDQLAKPGRMFIPVEDNGGYGNQDIWQVDKDKQGNVAQKKLFAVRYVPLTNAESQWPVK
ncbi:protein-L-isoaspartate O-methyltransferase [Acaromyces ingoldii]|uniref:Protein-L-isoaspartate O-methyltransferase n=1 Tax=Acaromyces ingoldii TaxID=215250 RepID=A0A316YTT0_9BASI|nr:protein-L-isoaspartate O-methyltransferase [Acaromyces ingoldii]PWN91433.1 protein-L-isoaspartate O-methyltransferase [Acaromyces ingoldii]